MQSIQQSDSNPKQRRTPHQRPLRSVQEHQRYRQLQTAGRNQQVRVKQGNRRQRGPKQVCRVVWQTTPCHHLCILLQQSPLNKYNLMSDLKRLLRPSRHHREKGAQEKSGNRPRRPELGAPQCFDQCATSSESTRPSNESTRAPSESTWASSESTRTSSESASGFSTRRTRCLIKDACHPPNMPSHDALHCNMFSYYSTSACGSQRSCRDHVRSTCSVSEQAKSNSLGFDNTPACGLQRSCKQVVRSCLRKSHNPNSSSECSPVHMSGSESVESSKQVSLNLPRKFKSMMSTKIHKTARWKKMQCTRQCTIVFLHRA